MANLTRLSIYSQERSELPDARAAEAFAQLDWSEFLKGFMSVSSYILAGFEVSNYADIFSAAGVDISMNNLVLFHSESTTQATGFYTSSGSEADEAVSLSASTTNYIEADLSVATGTPDERIFWDPAASAGAGAEYKDTVDTVVNLVVTISVNSTGFTEGKIPLYKAITNASRVVTSLTDCRKLYFRLGSGGTSPDAANVFAFPELPGVAYARADTGDTATAASDPKPFEGGDKNFKSEKQWKDAVMTKILELGGTDRWFSAAAGSIKGALRLHSTILCPGTAGAKFTWSGTALSITDSSGAPSASDNVGLIRRFGVAGTLNLRRADGQVSTAALTISDGQVMYVALPDSTAGRNYATAGSGATNYKTVARDSFVADDFNYWIAYREGTRLILRGGVELESGEDAEIGDQISLDLLANIGLATENAAPSYSSSIRGVAAESIVTRAGTLTDNLGDAQEDRSAYMRSASLVTWSGTALSFSSNIILEVINTKTGVLTQHSVSSATYSPLTLTNLESAWIEIDRTAASESVVLRQSSVDAIPAQSAGRKDVFVLFKRVDVSGIGKLHLPLHKQMIEEASSLFIGSANVAAFNPDTILTSISIVPFVTDWADDNSNFIPDSAAFGTVTLKSIQTRRVGDSLHVRGYWKCGTVAGSAARLNFSLYAIDAAKLTPTNAVFRLGTWTRIRTGSVQDISSGNNEGPLTYSLISGRASFSQTTSNDLLIVSNGNAIFAASDGVFVEFVIPVLGWAANALVGSVLVNNSGNILIA